MLIYNLFTEVAMLLTQIFGECSQVKLIDFLVAHPWSEYSKTELADGAGIARPTLYKLLEKLLTEELILETKKVGNIQLYQTNRKSPIIKRISSLQGFLADRELEKQKKTYKQEPVKLTNEELDEHLGLESKPGSDGEIRKLREELGLKHNVKPEDIKPEFR